MPSRYFRISTLENVRIHEQQDHLAEWVRLLPIASESSSTELVWIALSSLIEFQVKHADVTYGPGPVNFQVEGEDSTTRGKALNGTLPGCADKFVSFPEMQ